MIKLAKIVFISGLNKKPACFIKRQKKDLDFSRPIRLNKKRELYIYNKYIIPKKLLFFIANINKT